MRNRSESVGNSHADKEVSAEMIKRSLSTRVVGTVIIYTDETTSTNDEGKKLAEEGAVEGTTVIAGTQTAGRGRFNREWVSPRGGVWMSVVLRPPSIRPLQKLALLAGLSVAKTLRSGYNIAAALKWPNDVLVDGRKICGILVEGVFHGETPLYVIVGIGLNANIDMGSFPGKLKREAISMRRLLRRDSRLNELIVSLLSSIDRYYDLYLRGEDNDIWRQYESLCTTIGSKVRVECGEGEVHEGVAKGISPDGGLVIRTRGGLGTTVLSGYCIQVEKKTTKNIKEERRKLRQ